VTYREVALTARACAGWCVVLLGFSIPLSTALDGVLVGLTVSAWLIALPLDPRGSLAVWVRTRPALVALLLFCMLLAACAWSPVPWKAAWSAASKYIDLLLIPVFIWAAASIQVRRRALYCFLAGVTLNLFVSYGSAFGLWESIPGRHTLPSYPVGFRLSVTHNLLVSLGAYMFLLLAREARSPGLRAACVAMAAICAHNVLFIVIGRTGYVVLAVLLTYFIFNAIPGRRRVLLAFLAMTALFASAYFGSDPFSNRMQDIASDLTQWRPGAGDETSVGQRIGYYRNTLEIIGEHPLGVGTGGFPQAYAEKVRGTSAPPTVNPHNDYLMLTAQAGVQALLLLIALYVVLWREAPRLATRLERDALRGLVATMAIAGFFNSALMDHVEGLLFAWGLALLYASHPTTRETR